MMRLPRVRMPTFMVRVMKTLVKPGHHHEAMKAPRYQQARVVFQTCTAARLTCRPCKEVLRLAQLQCKQNSLFSDAVVMSTVSPAKLIGPPRIGRAAWIERRNHVLMFSLNRLSLDKFVRRQCQPYFQIAIGIRIMVRLPRLISTRLAFP
mmetsp:Transcript_10159/g.25163  ORF Transcript_10159/g.25163 Transcript_10159/m.25163 type:complete len:150 (-) Transcript_10159:291-740(-)